MYAALYALLTAAGVAIAWRSNPMYTLGRTLRFLVITGCAVAVLVGAILAVVHVTDGMSDTTVGVALGITILLGTMFFVWAIVTASTPRVGSIPPGTKLVDMHRARVVPWFKRLLIALVLGALLVAVSRGDTRDVVLIFGGLIAYLAIIMLFTFFIAAQGMDRSLTSIEAEPWIHWSYAPEAWAAWCDVLVSRTAAKPRSWIWSRDWKKFAVIMSIIAVAMVVLYSQVMPLPWTLSYVAFVAILMGAIIEGGNRIDGGAAARLRRLIQNAPHETYAGAAGIFCDGAYVPWLTPSTYLISATIDERAPRCIDLEFEQIVAGAPAPRQFTQSVLIPPDAEDDIRMLQMQLAARCPSATVALEPRIPVEASA